MHRNVVVPGLPNHHIGDLDEATLELTGGGIDKAVALGLDVYRLRIEQHHPYLTRLELASALQGGDELFVVQVTVTEIPAQRCAANTLAVGDGVLVFVMRSHRPVRQSEQCLAVGVESAERVPHVHRDLRGFLTAVELLQLGGRHVGDGDDARGDLRLGGGLDAPQRGVPVSRVVPHAR